jgi:colicin import membrane protein
LRAIFLAIVVHLVFFALIVFGVTWQSQPTPPVQAELWKDLPPVTKSESKPPAPEPAKPEPPKPEPPKPEPAKPPEDVKPEPPKVDPKVAEKKEREQREREKKEKLEKEKKEKLEREKEKQKQDEAKKKREDEKRRQDDEKAKREAEKAREVASAARQIEFDRFVNGIKSKIRGKANVPDTVTGHPLVTVRIRILPGGEVLDISIERSSGNRLYDQAIERAIRSASPLPVPPVDSELFPQFRDLRLNIEHDR